MFPSIFLIFSSEIILIYQEVISTLFLAFVKLFLNLLIALVYIF